MTGHSIEDTALAVVVVGAYLTSLVGAPVVLYYTSGAEAAALCGSAVLLVSTAHLSGLAADAVKTLEEAV